MHLTIAYLTNRLDPKIEWFFDSLQRETGGNGSGWSLVVVDFNHADRPSDFITIPDVDHVPPKPTVWQGPHRLTKDNYFAAANARNTALCLASDGWIVFVDDLSVLMPGWLAAVREAMAKGYVACGAYRKVKNLVVEAGKAVSFEHHAAGVDHRWNYGRDDKPVKCGGNWAYGCSLALPVDLALSVGGYPEALCDGCGYEDTVFGLMLENAGATFRYDRRMLTLESEEHHHLPGQFFKRDDPCKGDPNASPRDDQSHAMLNYARANRYHPNYFGAEGIRGLRQRVLAGEDFPVMQIPEHRWFDGKPLAEL